MRKTKRISTIGVSVDPDWARAAVADWPPSDDPAAEVPPPDAGRGRSYWVRHDPIVCRDCGLKFSPRAFAFHRVPAGTFKGQLAEMCCPEVEFDRIGLFCFDPKRSLRWYSVNPASSKEALERLLRDLAGGGASWYQIACCRPFWGRPETLAQVLALVVGWHLTEGRDPGFSRV